MMSKVDVNPAVMRADFWERTWRAFYTAALATGGPLAVAHLGGAMEDVASGNWHALWSLAVTVAVAALSAGVTAVRARMNQGLGEDPNSGSAKGVKAERTGAS